MSVILLCDDKDVNILIKKATSMMNNDYKIGR